MLPPGRCRPGIGAISLTACPASPLTMVPAARRVCPRPCRCPRQWSGCRPDSQRYRWDFRMSIAPPRGCRHTGSWPVGADPLFTGALSNGMKGWPDTAGTARRVARVRRAFRRVCRKAGRGGWHPFRGVISRLLWLLPQGTACFSRSAFSSSSRPCSKMTSTVHLHALPTTSGLTLLWFPRASALA